MTAKKGASKGAPKAAKKAAPKPEYKGLPRTEPPSWSMFALMIVLVAIGPLALAYFCLVPESADEPEIPPPVQQLEVMRIPAPAKQTASVIFLHGLGDTGSGWKFLADAMHQTHEFEHTGFVLPTAPERRITAYNQTMTGWFDIVSEKVRCDRPSLLKSLAGVNRLINEEISRGIPAERIILGGFSQGSALVQASAVTLPTKIGGFVAISGFLPRPNDLVPSNANLKAPFLIQHGDSDSVVDIQRDIDGLDTLKGFGLAPLFKSYEGIDHSLGFEGLQDLMVFFDQIIPDEESRKDL